MQSDINFVIVNNTKRKTDGLPFSVVKEYILGKKYELTLIFSSKKVSQELNIKYRQKDYIPNILSFPYSKTNGEIFINLDTAKKQAPDFELDFYEYVLFLFIHGCLHLKGIEHSSNMEREEQRIFKKFNSTKNYAKQKK